MEILGVGIPELLFVVILALILLGPKEMAETGRALGKWLNRFIRSDTYRALNSAKKELTELPTRLMREANLDEAQKDLELLKKDLNRSPISAPSAPKARTGFDESQVFAASPEAPQKPDSSS